MRGASGGTALRDSEELFRGAFDSAVFGFAIADIDGRLRGISKSVESMLGHSETELEMRSIGQGLSHPDDPAGSARIRRESTSGAWESARIIKRYVHKDGHEVWLALTASLMHDIAGGPPYLVMQVMDMQPRRAAEQTLAHNTTLLRESEERFRCAFESTVAGFALLEIDGSIRAVNDTLCKMFGYTKEEMLARTFPGLSHPDDREQTQLLRDRLVEGKADHFVLEKRYIHKGGNIIWGRLALAIVRVGAIAPYFVSQVTDITERKEVDRVLAERSADLERSNRELETFAYVASHDLQQPLRTISSYSRLVLERYTDNLDARGVRWLQHIQNGVDHMQNLITDLLQLSKVSTDGEGSEPTDTAAVTQAAWEILSNEYETTATIVTGGLPTIMAVKPQIEQLIGNLLDNAFKYRRRRTELMIKADATLHGEGEAAYWEFTVADNGIGFDAKHSEDIFEMFRRLHASGSYEGTGIGLTICRRIVERHGGRIWAESNPGNGATFHFTLPVRHRATIARQRPSQ